MSKNVLIVDDEELILETLVDILEGYADHFYTATDGEKGLEILKSKEVGCVISDINMPVKDGIQFVKDARALGFKTPFIFFTAHGNKELMLEAVKYGVFDFIDKPNFEGLEDSLTRGFKENFRIKEQVVESIDEKVNEYRKLLNKKE